jgi:hypothetical protein
LNSTDIPDVIYEAVDLDSESSLTNTNPLHEIFDKVEKNIAEAARKIEADDALFIMVLENYGKGSLEREFEDNIEAAFREINLSSTMKHTINELFQSYEHTDSIVSLLIEAEIKDENFIVDFIDQNRRYQTVETNERLYSLIQNQGQLKNPENIRKVDEFLLNISAQRLGSMRDDAIDTRAWNAASNMSDGLLLEIINEYLLDYSPNVREKMYDIIELEVVDSGISLSGETISTLHTMLESGFLVSNDEKKRVYSLKRMLQSMY